MKLHLLVEGGYDHEHPVVLAICTSENAKTRLINKVNKDGGLPLCFPWNNRGWLEIEPNQLIDWEAMYAKTTLVELAEEALSSSAPLLPADDQTRSP